MIWSAGDIHALQRTGRAERSLRFYRGFALGGRSTLRCMSPMTYIFVRWQHQSETDPVDLYSELDADGWEVRKVEVFRDGRTQFANATSQSGDTFLGTEPTPPLGEIALDAEFIPREITLPEFEAVWSAATRQDK